MPKFISHPDTVCVSIDFIEKIMPAANGAFVKVYLYGLAAASRGQELDFAAIAHKLGLLESEVVQAFSFWQDQGAVSLSDDSVLYITAQQPQSTESAVSDLSAPQPASVHKKIVPDLDSMTRDIDQNEELAEMFQVAQEVLGKTITNSDLETLYWLYKELGFLPEAILMILEYCVSLNKRSMSYVEQVAIGLHDRGIISIEDVDRFISSESERKSYLSSLKQLFGINDRSLTGMEERFLITWHDEWGMSEEMIALAYEYCVMRTNKLSFQYMNGILQQWYQKNIHTLAAAEQDHQNFKAAHTSAPSGQQNDSSYSSDDLERLAWEKANQ